MIFRARRVRRDREAGMVFDWRSGHGSTSRLLIAALVSASFWGVLFAYVQIRESKPSPLVDQQIDLTIVDLSQKTNRWFADLIEGETLFHERWDVADSTTLDQEISRALAATVVRSYAPQLREIPLPNPEENLRLEILPGMGPGVLPPPAPVTTAEFSIPPVNWWVEVKPVQGVEDWEGFSFSWPDPTVAMSEGESWTIVLSLDWQGKVITCFSSEQLDDPRIEKILAQCRAASFPALETQAPIRLWKLQAEVVNRPGSK